MERTWYREGVVYEIYPRSFRDSNGDGIGDLRGIIEAIPHIADLGATIVWLTPVYASPNADNGYDISDYRAIQPEFGTMADMEELIKSLHARGIRLIMDLVVNHTSDRHPWFARSVAREPGWEDFYHWSKTKKNWGSCFGGSAWEYHPVRGEWYLHLFAKEQPDLNWEHPGVLAEVEAILEFWLAKGVDGFRCDAINMIAKTDGLPPGKRRLILTGREHFLNEPKVHRYLGRLRDDVLSRHDCFTVGETAFVTPESALAYLAEDRRELDMLFGFDHMAADCHYVKWFPKRFRPLNLKRPLSRWQKGLDGRGWNTLYLENHDQPRSVSRFDDGAHPRETAKMLAALIFLEQGTPFVYQGQELGMTNAGFTELSQYRDIESLNVYRIARKTLLYSHAKAMRLLGRASRDNARTPMQWNAGENAGFTTGTPWLAVNPNHATINAEAERDDPDSVLAFYRKLFAFRRAHPVAVYGDYRDIAFRHPRQFSFERRLDGDSLVVVANFGARPLVPRIDVNLYDYDCLLGNYADPARAVYQPYEVRVYLRRRPPGR